jgi:hypothetical protein
MSNVNKIKLSEGHDSQEWDDDVVNDINTRIVTFLTNNFDLTDVQVRAIAQGWTEQLTVGTVG